MPRNGWYSNGGSGDYLVRTRYRVNSKPYVSSGGFSNLTPRERAARNLTASGFGGGGGLHGNTIQSGTNSFFSPQLSTDFLELPQSLREKREIYRHFYNTDELVGQAIDLHTELPLSKVRLAAPKPRTHPEGFDDAHDYGQYILSKFERMCKNTKLFQQLITIVHHYWLDGTCLPAGETVTVDGGVANVENVRVGDQVLTHKGRWRAVTATTQLRSPGILSFEVSRLPDPLRVTEDHPLEVLGDEGPEFREARNVHAGDWVRATYPTETSDVTTVSLLDTAPPNVQKLESGGYSVVRTQSRLRSENAAKARKFLLEWLRDLEIPTVRSRRSIAQEAGVAEHTLHNVLLTLQRELPVVFKQRLPKTAREDASTLWFPTNVGSEDTYNIERSWIFSGPATLPVDEDLLYVIGYWLGDGTLGRDCSRAPSWGRGLWSVTGGDSSLEYLRRVHQSLSRLLGSGSLRWYVDDRDDGPLHTISVSGNPAFVEWWSAEFGETAHGSNPKRIPPWVLTLPQSKQTYLLAGLIDSDGCVPRTHTGGVTFSNTSRNIITGARDIMLRMGSVPSLSKTPLPEDATITIRGSKATRNHIGYVLTEHNRDKAALLVEKACKASRFDPQGKFHESHNSYLERPEGVYFRVRNITKQPGDLVYNIQVEEDESFRAGFVSTHNCAIFAEDSTVDAPMDVGHTYNVDVQREIGDDGEPVEVKEEVWTQKDNAEDLELSYYQKHYEGWSRIIVLPIDKVKITTFSFVDGQKVELIPSDRDRALLDKARQGDPTAQEMIQKVPQEVREHMERGRLIPLGTDPDEGSFCYILSGRKHADSEVGQSILDRCLRTLYFREKLRQAQTSIASRAMTPKRIVWAEGLSDGDVDMLREQVDLALVDPDYSIVANYEIRWEEMGARDRLLDLSAEYEQTERRLITGLGVTESLMSGEALYSGDRLKLETMNSRYLHLREIIQEYVHQYLFEPVARRMGFVEKDKWGQEVVLYPRLSFTRLPLRDSQDTFDAMFNLYQKGSISIDLILETLNIDADDTKTKLEKDLFTVNDATFNEIIRSVANEVGRSLAEKTDVTEKVAQYLSLQMKPGGDEGGGRF